MHINAYSGIGVEQQARTVAQLDMPLLAGIRMIIALQILYQHRVNQKYQDTCTDGNCGRSSPYRQTATADNRVRLGFADCERGFFPLANCRGR
ncbi:MAG: hypothetical protein M0R33_05035 [Methylomonas sp.]|nr:hypothetical protein [Methylomonas sp.]MCK9605799.1 hypothetical protein [Methylomonas sp.]